MDKMQNQEEKSKSPEKMQIEETKPVGLYTQLEKSIKFDFKQYTFSPLLLFTDGYFDKGYSNYNSVADFYQGQINLNMLENVIYEKKNMKYEDLLEHVVENKMLIVCCIEAHFTALRVLDKENVLHYDPMSPTIEHIITAESCSRAIIFYLMKCKYGDQGHVSDNKDYYTGANSNDIRRYIYKTWKDLGNDMSQYDRLYLKSNKVSLPLDEYYFFNNPKSTNSFSTQATGNTCYFQVYLFGLFCKITEPTIVKKQLQLYNLDKLKQCSIIVCRFLNEFYFNSIIARPLTCNNLIFDFSHYQNSQYYQKTQNYLKQNKINIDYEQSYEFLSDYYNSKKELQNFTEFRIEEKMSSTINTKQLQLVTSTQDADYKICGHNYFKYRPANMMFAFNTNIMRQCETFNQFNSLRKNFLLGVYPFIQNFLDYKKSQITKYKDYYFMPQYEIGQKELVETHFYTYNLDLYSLGTKDSTQQTQVFKVNKYLSEQVLFSTNKYADYEKILKKEIFLKSKSYNIFENCFMTIDFFKEYAALGFPEFNPAEKEINCLTQSVFYETELMRGQMYKQEFEFERECLNQMAKSTLLKYQNQYDTTINLKQSYKVDINIGVGFTYSKFNNFFHFINIIDNYWYNPDINYIQIFGKDIRCLLSFFCQKIIFSENKHDYYHYGHLESDPIGYSYSSRQDSDLIIGQCGNYAVPLVSQERKSPVSLVISDYIIEYNYVRNILLSVLKTKTQPIKTYDNIINICLLSLLLDYSLYDQFFKLINLHIIQHDPIYSQDKKQLQIQISNMINEQEKKNKDLVQRMKIESLINECSYKFMVNKYLNISSEQFKLINVLNSDKNYYQYTGLCKVYMSLCTINKSTELDYYKIKCDNDFKIIIPSNYSHITSMYLDQITSDYNFSQTKDYICYDQMELFDMKQSQPEINLYKIRFVSERATESMYRYVELQNTLKTECNKILFFICGNILMIETKEKNLMQLNLNEIAVKLTTFYGNDALSFFPCFKYLDSDDIIILTSPNIYYHVDIAGHNNENYYGMKHEMIDYINLTQGFIDANDNHQFKDYKLSQLLSETKTVLYSPNYLVQIHSKIQLISLVDLALKIRNISLYILVTMFLERMSINLSYSTSENKKKRIMGPWYNALLYLYKQQSKPEYDRILSKQFFQINKHQNIPLAQFIDILCENFMTYQEVIDGKAQIIPTQKQKKFLMKIITGQETFYFSEVGSGKTKVIMPILCQMFLSNNIDAHKYLSKGGLEKTCLFVIVPEHMVIDAQTQVFRYCLNLNFKAIYKVYDDVFNLLNSSVQIDDKDKIIFICSFNQFKKAMTYDSICDKLQKKRDRILLIIDEVDDFLDRDKLVFNICQQKNNEFEQNILEAYYQLSSNVYNGTPIDNFSNYINPNYWQSLQTKFFYINEEIKQRSKSINKSFGIFNEQTLKHCSSNIVHDIEGYKCLIARPYESVNMAMPGSYYSDVERTLYLTYYILMHDIEKYDDLFQQERKFITFEYYNEFIHNLDYDELIYGDNKLSDLVEMYPLIKTGLIKYLYQIIIKKMEIQDRSRSVNSIDVIFNFDCKGFTGTPFIDNYPTYQYIKQKQQNSIPDLIDRSFYLHFSDPDLENLYKDKFKRFQGDNNNVIMQYYPSDFLQDCENEEQILGDIILQQNLSFNCIVDLAGIFKRIDIHGVKNVIKKHFGQKYKYIYHIDQGTCADRILYMDCDTDVQYDEEFYKNGCLKYGENIRNKIFFFIDNRNVTGKDIPFQLIFFNHYKFPLIEKSVVVAHDVDDFSKIWQAMGRSRTMNITKFIVYKNNLKEYEKLYDESEVIEYSEDQLKNIQDCLITKYLYIKNCDKKVIGNLSSIYQTLISLYNVKQNKFYYDNEIVNVFILKMDNEINNLLEKHKNKIHDAIIGSKNTKFIFYSILKDKFKVNNSLQNYELENDKNFSQIILSIFDHKFEQRILSQNKFDEIISFLSGDQNNIMELSYTKQQQKQKQQSYNKNQDSDTMQIFDRNKQISFQIKTEDYYEYTMLNQQDLVKKILNYPVLVDIVRISYTSSDQQEKVIRVFPTVQFLYSYFLNPDYITKDVHTYIKQLESKEFDIQKFFEKNIFNKVSDKMDLENDKNTKNQKYFNQKIECLFVRQNPQFSLLSLGNDIFVIGMKNQFNKWNIDKFSLGSYVRYICDETAHVLYVNQKKNEHYDLNLYILLDNLTKQELANNVINYYQKNPEKLKQNLAQYDGKKGEGFICWRFIMDQYLQK